MPEGHCIIYQADSGGPGVLTAKNREDDFSRSALIFHNLNEAQGLQQGLHFCFDASRNMFKATSVSWLKALLLKFLTIIFPGADIVYADTDLGIQPQWFPEDLDRQ